MEAISIAATYINKYAEKFDCAGKLHTENQTIIYSEMLMLIQDH